MPDIDYRDLLKRYMAHVESIEGTTFLTSSAREFSPAERVVLFQIADEVFSDVQKLTGNLADVIHKVEPVDSPLMQMLRAK